MIRLHIITEGQTEEEFVKSILTDHLGYFNITTNVRCVTTSQKLKKRGGVVSYEKIKKDINLWLKQDRDTEAKFTTMFDLYALPNEFPQFDEAYKKSDPYEKVKILENALSNDIKDPRFIPYIQLHEFETLILCDPSKLIDRFPVHRQNIQNLVNVCANFESPELINDGANTAPSKRIIQFIPDYKGAKVSVAPLIIQKIGLETIRRKCPHFNQWITQLENLTNDRQVVS